MKMKFAKIISNEVKLKSETKVYDLQVDKDNSYNVNDLIVHNSCVSSLIGYVLGIHRINPLDPRWGEMPFERFLASDRNIDKIILEDAEGNKKEFLETDEIELQDGTKKLVGELIEGDEIV